MHEIKTGIKKRWTPQEDQALRQIKQNLKYKSWNMISKKMATDFDFHDRSQKQCRDRYQNYLKGREQSFLWSQQEEKKMFKLFGKQGSRWQLISSYFTNIKGIHIKNKFYTRVRKAVRQVNSVIEFYFTRKYQPFEFNIISKLVALISRHVEQTKYEKRPVFSNGQFNNEQQEQHQYIKILYELIELTNHQGCQLFPQLGFKTCPHTEKKKLFKKLIKKLKQIEIQYQKSNPNSPFPIQTSSNIKQNNNQSQQNKFHASQQNHIKYECMEKHMNCNYKIITTQAERKKSFFPIISRVKKLKLSSQRQYQKKQREILPFSAQQFKQNQEKQQISHQPLEIPFQQTLEYPQFYLVNTQPGLYLASNMDFENIQLFYNME